MVWVGFILFCLSKKKHSFIEADVQAFVWQLYILSQKRCFFQNKSKAVNIIIGGIFFSLIMV